MWFHLFYGNKDLFFLGLVFVYYLNLIPPAGVSSEARARGVPQHARRQRERITRLHVLRQGIFI